MDIKIDYAEKALKIYNSSLQKDEVVEKLQELVRKTEQHIFNITGPNPLKGYHDWIKGYCRKNQSEEFRLIEKLIHDRSVILNILFKIHCSDEEIERLKKVNSYLLNLRKEIYGKTADTYRKILQWYEKDHFEEDIEIEGSIKYLCNEEGDFVRIEDDDFYSSDFGQMLAVISATENEKNSQIELAVCNWQPDIHKSDMSDRELDIEDIFDDGNSWNEGFEDIPELKDIVLCYTVHEICCHRSYSIPDLLRMNNFYTGVKVQIENERETDGSSQGWWEKCTEEQFVKKFLYESKHRPKEMSLATFIRKRVNKYFEFELYITNDSFLAKTDFTTDEEAVQYLSKCCSFLNMRK